MRSPEGCFYYYQKWRFWTNRINYMRWSQAGMLLALAEFAVTDHSSLITHHSSLISGPPTTDHGTGEVRGRRSEVSRQKWVGSGQ